MFDETAASVDAGFTYLFINIVLIAALILYVYTAACQKEIIIIFDTIKHIAL